MIRSLIVFGAVCLLSASVMASVPTSITLQGRATDASGVPLPTGDHAFVFRIFDSEFGIAEVWPGGGGEMQTLAVSDDGLWIARIGANLPLTTTVFGSDSRWLQITVDGVTLPRIRIVTSPYALRVGTVDGATGGNIASEVSIGLGHTITAIGSFVAGSSNTVTGESSVIAGGIQNTAAGVRSTVTGGESNSALGLLSAIGGGALNVASAPGSSVAGGVYNQAKGQYSHVGGGGGFSPADSNSASGPTAVVAGGSRNVASGVSSSVGGGSGNRAIGSYSHIGGGGGLTAVDSNVAYGLAAVIGGGTENSANGDYSVIAGGRSNSATAIHASVIGGLANTASAEWAVAGGSGCIASGLASLACGGGNEAAGQFSAALGWGSRALHDRAFVWTGGESGSFTSTAADQFLVRAPGGVGIGTNAPAAALDLAAGKFRMTGGLADVEFTEVCDITSFVTTAAPVATNPAFRVHTASSPTLLFTVLNNGNVGVRLSNPTNAIHVLQNTTNDPLADAWTTYSSRRWKENITPIPNALDKVQRLSGVEYDWKENHQHDIGLIAEDVGEVIPEVVAYEDNGVDAKSVDYARLVALLIEGMKEQQSTIAQLLDRVAHLEEKLEQ